MKAMIHWIALAGVLTLVGCALSPTQVAQGYKECKVAPALTENAVNPSRRQPSELDRRYAEMQLRTSPYYQREYRDRVERSTVVEAARDCY